MRKDFGDPVKKKGLELYWNGEGPKSGKDAQAGTDYKEGREPVTVPGKKQVRRD